VHELAKVLNPDQRIQWKLGDPFLLVDELESSFDVVVGCLPLHSQENSVVLTSEDGNIELRDHMSSSLMLKASLLLEPDGTGFFVVPSSFFSKRSPHTVYANMSRFGVSVNAALSLPRGTFEPATGISSLLLIIKREDPKDLFVGELVSDARSSSTLLRNLQRRTEGKTTQLGTLLKPETFISFPALTAQRDVERLGRSLGVKPTALSEIAVELNLADRKKEEGFEDKANSVYLPLIGTSPAVTTLADFRIKPQNYIQIVVDTKKAIPSFVANSFNTPLGRKIRESVSSGVITKIGKFRLANAHVYLPDMDTQTETLRVQSVITNLATQLEEYERQLWRQPRDATPIDKMLRSLNREDSFESWIESLPFPLASILRSYHAENDATHQVSHLLNFFEALSQFVCTLLLSGLRNDSMLFARITEKWSGSVSGEPEWFKRSTFGGWNRLGEQLAKEIRRLLSSNETRQQCLDTFGSPDETLLDTLTNKKLFAILKEVKDNRDNWKGHSGIVGDQESQRRHTLLQSNLSNAMRLIADSYTTTQLIQPDSAQFRQGIFHYQVKLLMGANPIFKKIKVVTNGPMEMGKLHLLNLGQYKPIELLPFFRLMESPKTHQNALYFYNRVDGTKIRWVSYHFDPEAEAFTQDEEVTSALSLLSPGSNRSDE
jgi:hypothetical protein